MSETLTHPIQYIRNLISDYMQLDNQHCYIYNQNFIIPQDKGLCVVIGLNGSRIISNVRKEETKDDKYYQISKVYKQEDIFIKIFSYDFSAILRKDEILMALQSTEAENIMDKFDFYIASEPTNFSQTNEQDGSKILNIFTIDINVISSLNKEKETEYFTNSKFLLTIN